MAEINREGQFDMTLQREVLEYTTHLKNIHAQRNAMDNDMEAAFLLQWAEEGAVKQKMSNVKLTKHPGARNKLLGAVRLLIASDPVWSVPRATNKAKAKKESEKIEKMAAAIWQESGTVRQAPVHYDVVTSALLFAEMHIAITRTSDMVEWAKGGSKAAQVMAGQIAERTPYLFDTWDPRTGYPDLGPMGTTAFYNEIETTSGKILDEFGVSARAILKDPSKRYDKVTLCRFWDLDKRLTWIQGEERPLLQESHGLSFIPVQVQLGEGSRLFSKPEYQRQPFLYTEWKSQIWQRLNLLMTVLNTVVFAIGSNPMYLYKANQPGKKLTVDHNTPGKVAVIEAGEDFGAIVKNVIDPSLMQLYQTLTGLEEESTIYGQTLGESLSGNAPFSMVALLHQAGRLPLLVPQRMASQAIAGAMKKAFTWMKEDGTTALAGYGAMEAELKPQDIPDRFDLQASLDINLPQDMLQQANVANQLTQGERPLVSQRWAREEILKIGQPDEMQSEIWGELAGTQNFIQFVQDQLQRAQQAQAGPGGAQPNGSNVPDQGGKPPLQGIPPEMEQGGMQAPEMPGQEGMPPGGGMPVGPAEGMI